MLLIQVIKGKIERRESKEEDVSSCWMTYGKERILEIGRGSTRSDIVENSLWDVLWT
jgi:hypothetical protein